LQTRINQIVAILTGLVTLEPVHFLRGFRACYVTMTGGTPGPTKKIIEEIQRSRRSRQRLAISLPLWYGIAYLHVTRVRGPVAQPDRATVS
jgi:hypothetical protein